MSDPFEAIAADGGAAQSADSLPFSYFPAQK
jgi:hypothetical protein